ncbi:uncharacterized protein LOC123697609 [Colias croceus]|uniref:uncharacterized protein LOC123697609 n=1 Tax=Colias crocea TaxID=72248 RepID=UPI001E27B340|nr:uncharacterized protein LOC123697609 [Colias croceus]
MTCMQACMKNVNPHYRLHKVPKSSNTDVLDGFEDGDQNEGTNDKEVAEIDIANFIQSPDYDRLGNNYQFEEQFKRENPSNKNSFESLVDASLEEYDDKGLEYNNIDNDALEESSYNTKSNEHKQANNPHKLNKLLNNKEIHKFYNDNRHLEKKCAFKNMKIPFFSHDQARTSLDVSLATPKKNKKRKIFSFSSKKHKTEMHQTSTTGLSKTTIKTEENTFMKLNKRSYIEKICPLCKRKFIKRRSKPQEKQTNNIIHNSRQYYQNKQNSDENYNDKTEMKRMFKDTDSENLMKKNKILDRAYSDFERDQDKFE